MSCEMAPEREQSGVAASAQPAPTLDGRFVAVVLLHAASIAFMSMVAFGGRTHATGRPWEPLMLCAVAISMAQCSLGAIWWVRAKWPMYATTMLVVLACAVGWRMLLAVLEESLGEPQRAAGWAAAFGTQLVLTALLGTIVNRAIEFRRGQRYRFSIMSLLIWTTLVGCGLGSGQWLAHRFGWTPQNFFSWVYFLHLQAIAVINALVALAIFAAVRLTRGQHRRGLVIGSVLVGAVPATLAAMWGLFGRNLGVSVIELCLISAIHAALLAATLILLDPIKSPNAALDASSGGGAP